ncbi:O-unit flippase-like protein, partial [Aeromonas salmonicida]|uniref:O-unit flippase-like protein n=1 Tax=Aeromonas salmonicida TaxID=645 RepID=UPI0035A5C999
MIRKESQLIVGLINQIVNILCPFLITVIGLKYTSAEIGSVWLIFLSMMVLVNLFDFGLSPTIIRNVSYIVSGARGLAKDGLEEVKFKSDIDYSLLKRLLIDIKTIYKILSLIALVVILLGGGGYFYYISPAENQHEIILSWVVFSAGLLMSLYYLYYTPVLCGFGVIQKAYLANIIGRLTWLILTFASIKLYPNLLTLSLSFLMSVVVNRVVIKVYYHRNHFVSGMQDCIAKQDSTIPFIAHNTIKLGIVSLGSFLISRATVLIAGASLPLVLAGEYTFSLQIFMALLAVGNVFVTVKVPELSRLVMLKDKKNMRYLIVKVISVSLSFYIVG